MYKKKYHHLMLVTKLLTFIVIFALHIPATVFSQSCDRDGICEAGEDQDSCVYDCLVSTLHKDIKLHGAYATEKVIRYRLNGTREEITNIDQVKDFLLANLDFAIYGIVGNYRLFNLTENIPVVISRNPMHCNDLTAYPYKAAYQEFMEYNQHEEFFGGSTPSA